MAYAHLAPPRPACLEGKDAAEQAARKKNQPSGFRTHHTISHTHLEQKRSANLIGLLGQAFSLWAPGNPKATSAPSAQPPRCRDSEDRGRNRSSGIVGLLLAAARGGAPGRWLGGRKGFGFDGRMMSGGLGRDRRVQRSSLMQASRGWMVVWGGLQAVPCQARHGKCLAWGVEMGL